jgi:hypothetical protein
MKGLCKVNGVEPYKYLGARCLDSLTKLFCEPRADNSASQCEQRNMRIVTSLDGCTSAAF